MGTPSSRASASVSVLVRIESRSACQTNAEVSRSATSPSCQPRSASASSGTTTNAAKSSAGDANSHGSDRARPVAPPGAACCATARLRRSSGRRQVRRYGAASNPAVFSRAWPSGPVTKATKAAAASLAFVVVTTPIG